MNSVKLGYKVGDMDKNRRKLLLESYLGMFRVKITENELGDFKIKYNKIRPFYLEDSKQHLLKVGCYHLLNFGKIDYKTMSTFDLVNIQFGRNPDYLEKENITDVGNKLLIITHFYGTPTFKNSFEMVNAAIESRVRKRLPTIVLTEIRLTEVLNFFNRLDGKKCMVEIGNKKKDIVTIGQDSMNYISD